MRQAARRVNNSAPWFTMGTLATGTTAIGLYLLNPLLDTFRSGAAWGVIASLHIGRFRPDESSWGTAFATLGLAMALSLWLLSEAVNADGYRLAEMVFGFSRLVWGGGAIFWAGVGASFFASNPAGIAPILAIVFGMIPSAWVATRVRVAVGAARGVGGGA